MSSLAHRGFVHLGMDVSKDSIAVAVLQPDSDVAEIDKIFHDSESVRHLIKRLGRPSSIWACYEAGPTGYDLHRLLNSIGVRCDVVAPSLIPKGSGDRVKTDRRDARRLAGLHRAGGLTPVAVPSPAEEAVRDLCRTRGDMVQDLTRARNRLSSLLLRHSVVWRGGSPWTERHRRWLAAVSFDNTALSSTYAHYLSTVRLRDVALESVEADLAPYCTTEPFGSQVARLSAYRGVTSIGGLCLAAEVFDWRRFPRARSFMSFTGLVPSEHSSGHSEHRGYITRAGNAHLRGQLCEAAWAYQHSPNVGPSLRLRQQGVAPETLARSWTAQARLSRRFRALASHKNARSVVAAAIARELDGFLWAEMVAEV